MSNRTSSKRQRRVALYELGFKDRLKELADNMLQTATRIKFRTFHVIGWTESSWIAQRQRELHGKQWGRVRRTWGIRPDESAMPSNVSMMGLAPNVAAVEEDDELVLKRTALQYEMVQLEGHNNLERQAKWIDRVCQEAAI